MEELFEKVKKTILNFKLIEKRDRVLIAVSGGIDSMVLTTILYSLKDDFDIQIGIGTFNHHIRDESNLEVEMVCSYAKTLKIPCYKGEGNVMQYREAYKKTLEEAARDLRFQFLKEIKEKYNYNKIALAHNLNDFVETFFMHLFKGSGTKGLTSLLRNENGIIHPLVEVKRSEIEAFAKKYNLPYCVDLTNFDLSYERNSIRFTLSPLISSLYPNFENHILNTAEILLEENDFLENIAQIDMNAIKVNKDEYSLNLFNLLPLANKRRILFKLLDPFGSFEKIESVIDFLSNEKLRKINIANNLFLIKNGKTFFLTQKTPFTIDKIYTLEIPSTIFIEETNLKIEALFVEKTEIDYSKKDVVYFDFDILNFPLFLRFRQEGDFVEMDFGTKKLQDIFVDKKIKSSLRHKTPLLIDSKGSILWVVGIVRSKHAKVSESTRKVLALKAIASS